MAKRERFKLPIAAFMFLERDNKLLMIKRATTGWMDGYYSVPAGGMEENEEVLAGAIRETEEEVGVILNSKNVRLAHYIHCKIGDENWMGAFYVANIFENEPVVMEPHKHSEVKWVDYDNLPENTIPYIRQAINNYRQQVMYSGFGWDKLITL